VKEKNVKQVSEVECVTLPKIPPWWRGELEKLGCAVKIYPDPEEGSDSDIWEIGLDKCLLFLRYTERFGPHWNVVWDVSEELDSEQKARHRFVYTVEDDSTLHWYSGEVCDSLVSVQRNINEWIWCVKHYNKVRKTLLNDLFLKEFQITGCTMRVNPFPTAPHGSYELAEVFYGDTSISVSYSTLDHKWHFGGGVRRCSFSDPVGMIKSLHKRARRFLKEDY
jgi:hypothetical protein